MAEWVLLPLLRRREAECLRALAGAEAGDFAPTGDSPWQVSCRDGLDYAQPPAAGEGEALETPAAREPDFDPAALDFTYPHRKCRPDSGQAHRHPAQGPGEGPGDRENTARPYVRSAFAPPRFLAGKKPLTADQRGTAIHLVMEHLPWTATRRTRWRSCWSGGC